MGGAFIEYIIKHHIVAINDTKVWHIPTNSNKYKANCSKYSAKSNNYSAKSNKYSAKRNKYSTKCNKNSAITSITTCLQTGYFNYAHTLLLSNYLDQWEVSILITCSISSNQRARNVPQNGVQTNYVPQVPHVGYRWVTEYSRAQDTQKCGVFEKI